MREKPFAVPLHVSKSIYKRDINQLPCECLIINYFITIIISWLLLLLEYFDLFCGFKNKLYLNQFFDVTSIINLLKPI